MVSLFLALVVLILSPTALSSYPRPPLGGSGQTPSGLKKKPH